MQIEMEKEGKRYTVKGSNGCGGLHGREGERTGKGSQRIELEKTMHGKRLAQ